MFFGLLSLTWVNLVPQEKGTQSTQDPTKKSKSGPCAGKLVLIFKGWILKKSIGVKTAIDSVVNRKLVSQSWRMGIIIINDLKESKSQEP